MTDESDSVSLRRDVVELRSLLDLGHARERALLSALNGAVYLLEGAAVAPDRQANQEAVLSEVQKALVAMAQKPVANHGLFVEFARLQVSSTARASALQRLTRDYQNVVARCSALEVQVQIEEETVRQLTRVIAQPALSNQIREHVERAIREAVNPAPKEPT